MSLHRHRLSCLETTVTILSAGYSLPGHIMAMLPRQSDNRFTQFAATRRRPQARPCLPRPTVPHPSSSSLDCRICSIDGSWERSGRQWAPAAPIHPGLGRSATVCTAPRSRRERDLRELLPSGLRIHLPNRCGGINIFLNTPEHYRLKVHGSF